MAGTAIMIAHADTPLPRILDARPVLSTCVACPASLSIILVLDPLATPL
jgi:hypothetical protein